MPISEGNEIHATIPANLKKRIEYVGGKLHITDNYLHFKPHPFNVQSGDVVIPMEKVTRAFQTNILGVSPNGVSIELDNHTSYQFVIGAPWSDKRDEVIRTIHFLMRH